MSEVEKKPEESVEGTSPKTPENISEDIALADIATAEEYLSVKNITLLEYEKQMFLDLVHLDGLVVCAKGISYDRVLIHLLQAYSDTGNLILIINFSDWEEDHYRPQLDRKYVHDVANTAAERERVYLEGGIQFISTRILVVDLLKNRIPIELITGIIVMRAHSIVESCQEAFALRLYRQKNKTGFIKAFSSSAEAFTIGYSHVERTMRNLFVKELFIWPRFHAIVQRSLKPFEPSTAELHIPMTSKMLQIQSNILDLMNYLVKEIKRINRTVDMEEITVENCVTKKFHKILQAQLDCIWHQLNSQTKLIVSDLKVLRNLMLSTIYSDSIGCYALMKRYRTTEYALSNSGWTLSESADNMFKVSKNRVYNSKEEFEPELCPKWEALTELLKVEIPNNVKQNVDENDSSEPVKVLILCQDSRTCYQLNQYLTQGAERFLIFQAMKNDIPINKLSSKYKEIKNLQETEAKEAFDRSVVEESQRLTQSSSKSNKTNVGEKGTEPDDGNNESKEDDELSQMFSKADEIDEDLFKESYVLTMTQALTNDDPNYTMEEDQDKDSSVFEPFTQLDNLDLTAVIADSKNPLICIQTFKTAQKGSMALDRILNEIRPQYVIMYHYNVTAIRQLEVFEAQQRRKPKDRMKVFFLIHNKTVEEQCYLTSLRREKQAYELLINTKSKMVIPSYQDGKTEEAFILLKHHPDEEADQNTRQAGGQQKPVVTNPKIIVDMREFRSDLPCLIHRRGIEVMPVTISIGDYILTPEICVERKSISDLIGSLNSGRLYNQCIQMQRNYSKPILLIEFDQNKPFHLQGKYMLSGSTISNADILQKLQLLTLHFPKLRLIWSPSPYATAQLFEELKLGKPEPDSKTAAAIGSDEAGVSQIEAEKINPNIHDFMIRLPGINSKNIHKVMRNGGSLVELLKKTKEQLSELLDSEANGKMLWDILHTAHQPMKDEATNAKSFTSRFKRSAMTGSRGGGTIGRRF